MPYQRLTGDIAIRGGVARTENLLLESRAFDLSAFGQVDLVNQSIEMNVAVKPLQTVDRAVTSVPLVGWLLSGKKGAVIAAFYRVSGPLSDPVVTSLPARSIGRNVFGVFRRLLQLPKRSPVHDARPRPGTHPLKVVQAHGGSMARSSSRTPPWGLDVIVSRTSLRYAL
jgi:hypothetical protein